MTFANYHATNPLIVQNDLTILLEIDSPQASGARSAIAPFTELEKSPELIHTYRITPLSLWSAAAAGLSTTAILDRLHMFAKYPIAETVTDMIGSLVERWGRLQIKIEDNQLRFVSDDADLLTQLAHHPEIAPLLSSPLGSYGYVVLPINRGALKQKLMALDWPIEDLAGYTDGTNCQIALRTETFNIRDYQGMAAEAFYANGTAHGGAGVVVLPPGAGKTVVGIAAMSLVNQSTLILTTNNTSVNQWQRELLQKTHLDSEQIARYVGEEKGIAPITVSTYQMLTYRPPQSDIFPHLRLLNEQHWGLIIYDEVHLLPAPIFRTTAKIQSTRRLGLTATLIREDGREGDVFALIGPKKFEAPWRVLEQAGWIAVAQCIEVRVDLAAEERETYVTAEKRDMYRIAAENPQKTPLLEAILQRHPHTQTLIIGQYIRQLQQIAQKLNIPLITGKTPQPEREHLFTAFRKGNINTLVISRVGNFALDLPDADMLIQVSGTFGSRQEEAQRLGRILRPKGDGRQAYFYTLVTRDTRELEFAHNRQLFLAEQGYSYHIYDAREFLDKDSINQTL
ncbi:MAG: DNA repair helicase XPB [Chloroflexota bacterium]